MSEWKKQFLGSAKALIPFLEAEGVTDILINGMAGFHVERNGVLERHPNPFNEQTLWEFIERIMVPIGKRMDATQPFVDGKLMEGSRFHVIFPPAAPAGPLLSIRKLDSGGRVQLSDFGEPSQISWLLENVKKRKNILIVGGTGSGKTTLLSRLLDTLEEGERVVLLEESREVICQHPHLIFLEARPPSPEGKGEITLRTLLKQALRMRPDRLMVGESRGAEAFDLLMALNTGHRGSISTLHANSAIEALKRLECLACLGGPGVDPGLIRQWIAQNVDLVLFCERRGSARIVSQALKVEGLEGTQYRIHPVWGGS